jgi:hypothetical protein
MKIGRNDPCHCGSKKKYKKCCLDKDWAAAHPAPEPRKPSSPAQKAFVTAALMAALGIGGITPGESDEI